MLEILFYSVIACLTSLGVWTIINLSNRKRVKVINNTLHSQSSIHEIIKNFIPKNLFEKPQMITQSRKHNQKNMVKVIVFNDRAYWVSDNVFYVANTIDGRIDHDTAKPLDIENLSKKELVIMLDILDNLRNGEGGNDSRSSGDK